MSCSTSFHRTVFLALVASAVLVLSAAGTARAGVCKANGAECQTSVSCCQRNCVKPFVKKGKSLFGLCCPGGANALCGTTPACVDLKTDPNNCGACGVACDASQCLTCVNGTCASACESDEVCDQGECETTTTTTAAPTTTTAAPTTTTVTPTTSTTTTLVGSCPAQGAIIACNCGDGTPCPTPATFDCTGPTPSCTSKHNECVAFCGARGPGNCGTTPCISCTTNEPCLDPG